MFGGEIVKKKFPFKKKFRQNYWSKTKLDLENFHQKILFCKKP